MRRRKKKWSQSKHESTNQSNYVNENHIVDHNCNSIKQIHTCTSNFVLYKGSNCPDGFISRGILEPLFLSRPLSERIAWSVELSFAPSYAPSLTWRDLDYYSCFILVIMWKPIKIHKHYHSQILKLRWHRQKAGRIIIRQFNYARITKMGWQN